MSAQVMRASGGWSRPLRIGLAAGTASALIVLIPVLILQSLRGVGVVLEFQLTASSLIGRAAYGGTALTLLLGVVLHFFVAIASATVFALAAWRVPLLIGWAWISGPVLGIGVYFFMGLVVMPLSALSPPSPATAMPFLPSLLIHMLGFGLPISLLVRRWMTERA